MCIRDSAQTDHQNAADEQLEQNNGGKALQRVARGPLPQGVDAQHHRAEKDHYPQQGDQLKGGGGEGGDVGDGVPDQAADGPLGLALQPRLYLKLHLGGLKADPGGEGTEKGIFLPHSEQGIHRSAVQQLEVGGTGHINARSPADDGVKAFSRKGMQMCIRDRYLST